MNKQLLRATVLSALLLIECIAKSSSSAPMTSNILTNSDAQTTSAINDKLSGTWILNERICINDNTLGISTKFILTLNTTNMTLENKSYGELNCKKDDLFYHITSEYSYTIGNRRTKSSKGEEAYTFNYTQIDFTLHQGSLYGDESSDIGKTFYAMLMLNGAKLFFTDDTYDGTTPETRNNLFNLNFWWTKQ